MKKLSALLLLVTLLLLAKTTLYAQTPTISSFTPTSGAPGTLFTITGTNLSSPTAFKIGGVTASAIVVFNTGASLVGMVLPGAATGTIAVTTAGGTATSSGTFTVQNTSYPIVQQGTKLTASNDVLTPGKGWSVALSADGKTALVGGYYDNNGVGATWVYTRSGNTWAQQQKLIGTGAGVNAWQGFSVALSADGNTAIVGGVIDNSVWVFTRSGTSWAQQGNKLVASDRVGNAWFGKSVSLSADGNTAIVGGYWDNSNAGAAWVFTRSGSTWTQQGTKLVGTGAVGAAGQGHSVSLSADGSVAAIGGAYDDSQKGATWVFTRSGNTWVHQKIVVPGVGAAKQGQSVALSADATTLIIGGVNATSNVSNAWVFTRSGSTWTQQGTTFAGSDAVGTAANGTSVTLTADGNTAMMGSVSDNNNTGAAWVFTRSGTTWSQQGNKLLGTGATGTTLYEGRSVSLSADGSTALVGADGDNTNLGAVWAYSTGVIYDGNGNTGGTVPSSALATIGSSITLATNTGTLVKTGYTFAGWNTLANGTGTSYAEGASYTFAGTVRILAKWTPNNYTVTFNVNGGTGSMSSQTITNGASANLTSNTFTRTYYTFAGWNTLANGTGTSYANGASYTMGAANVTLYAQWTINNYTVTFNANSGTGSMTDQSIAYTSSANLTSNAFTRTGYTFAGWNTLANGTGTSYANGASYTMGSANVTLYAQWTLNNYTVTFNANSGTGSMSNQTIAYNASANLTSNAFTRTGYTFAGWNTLANGTGTSYANGISYTMGGANVTLYAQWTLNNYTVTFNVNGGTGLMSNQTIAYNASSNLTSNTFTRTYYTFAGWNTLANGTGTSYANGASYTMSAANVTLYAQWTPNNYTVTFNANNGTGTMSNQTIAYTSSANLTSNAFTRTGYSFAGWNTLANGTGTSYANSVSYTMGAADVTLYANWVSANFTGNYFTSGNVVFGAGVTAVDVSMWGGGGGGSAGGGYNSSGVEFSYSNGSGGGGSNWTGGNVAVVPGRIYNVTVGVGGIGGDFNGSTPLAGGDGTASSFLGFLSPGGYGGYAHPSLLGGPRANTPTPNAGYFATAGQDAQDYYGGNGGFSSYGNYGASGEDTLGSGLGLGGLGWPRTVGLGAAITKGVGYQSGVQGGRPGDGGGGGGYAIPDDLGMNTGSIGGKGAIINALFDLGFNLATNAFFATGAIVYKFKGGAGAVGRVQFYYNCNYQFTMPPLAPVICGSGPATITLRSSSMPSGSYVVTYNTSNPTTTGNLANMIFDDAANEGSFTTNSLSATSRITITNLSSGTTCSNAVNSNNVVTVIVENTTANDWNRSIDLSGAGRSGAVSFTLDNKAYLGTGKDASGYYKDFWVFNPTTYVWTQIADFEGSAREGALGLGIDGEGYVGTGTNGTSYFNDFWQYDPLRNDWIPRTSLPAAARSFSAGFVIGSKGYLSTGWNGTTYYNDFWEYNPSTNAWTAKAAFNGTARYQAVGFSIGSKGYLGTGGNGSTSYKDFSEYNPANNTWTTKSAFSSGARRAAVGFNVGNYGYIGSGWDATTNYPDFYQYDPNSNTWSAKAMFTARRNAVGFGLGSKGYIATGTDGSNYFNDLYEYSQTNTSISTGNISSNSFCTGTQIDIPFETGYCVAFNPTANTFIAQLSDAKGSFGSPTQIGTLTGSGSGTIYATLPVNTPVGANYRVRVIGTNPYTIGSDNGTDIAVKSTTTNTIQASASKLLICQGDSINLSVSSAAANGSDSSILLTGDFESAMDEWIFKSIGTYPHGLIHYAAPYNIWVLRDTSYSSNHSNDSSAYLQFTTNADRYLDAVTNEFLQTPVFSTIGFNAVTLKFYHHYRRGYSNKDSIRVQASKDYGASWSTVYCSNCLNIPYDHSLNIGYADEFIEQIVSLDNFGNEGALMVRFNYQASGSNGIWLIDNISIKGASTLNTYEWTSYPIGMTSSVQSPKGLKPTETTTYTVTNKNNYGCSAIVSSALVTVLDTSSSRSSIRICPSALPYTWNGLTFSSAGTKTARLTNSVGCDSLATLSVGLLPVSSSISNISICPIGLPFSWNGLLFTSGGTQTAHLTNYYGCDSAATLNLTIKSNTSSITNLNICETQLPYTWNSVIFTAAGSTTVQLLNSVGCDSTATLNLSLFPSSRVVASTNLATICPGGATQLYASSSSGNEINILKESFNASNNAWKTYNNSSGGQPVNSDWTLRPYRYSNRLSIGYEFITNDSSQFYLSSFFDRGNDVTTNTVLESPTFSTVGLSTASLTFFHHFFQAKTFIGNIPIDSIRVQISTNGSNWSDIYLNKTNSVGSVDAFVQQIISLNGYLNQPSLKLRFVYYGSTMWWAIDNVTVKGTIASPTYTWSSTPAGFSATQQNPGSVSPVVTTIYSVVAQNQFCSSSANTTVSLKARSVSTTTDLSICNTQLPYVWNGFTFNGAGTQTAHFTVAGACDSAATLVLSVKSVSSSNNNVAICPSLLPYVWNGLTFTEAGTKTAHLNNSVGCDSAATLVLSVYTSNAVSYNNMTICQADLPYQWNGQTLNGSGKFIAHLNNLYGCDSVVNLNLVVNPSPTNVLATASETTICVGESINLFGSVGAIASSRTILSENFNGNTDYWLSINESTGGSAAAAAWMKQPDGYLFARSVNLHSNDQSPFFISDSYAQGTGGVTNATLQSPVFSTVGISSGTLKFNHAYVRRDATESIKVQISTDGINWQNLYYNNTQRIGSYADFELISLSLDAYLNHPYVSIRFVYNATNDFLWAIDNVIITGTPTTTMSYAWSSSPAGFNSTQQNPTGVIPAQSGNFTCIATNTAGCSASASVQVMLSGATAINPVILNQTICQNELPYVWNGLTFTMSGSKTKTLISSLGCDSIVTLNLTVRTPKSSVTNLVRCAEDLPFVWNGLTFNAAGTQSVTLHDMYGCDSIATLNLFIPSSSLSVVASASDSSICLGMDVNLAATITVTPGIILSENFNAATNNWLTINNSSGTYAVLSGWNLRPAGYNGYVSNDNTQFYNTTSAVNSFLLTNTVLQSPTFSTIGYTSVGLSFYHYYRDWNTVDSIRVQASKDNGITWTNVYLHTTGSVGNPTSFQLTTVSLDVFADQPSVMLRFNYQASDNAYYWSIDNVSISGTQAVTNYSWRALPAEFTSSVKSPIGVFPMQNTTYNVTVSDANGCTASDDVTVAVSAALTPSFTNLTICQNLLPYNWNGLTFSSAGSQTAYLTGVSGCDSVATLTLSVKSLSYSNTSKEICAAQLPYVWNGLTFTVAGVKTATLQNTVGCDSLATLNLTVRAASSSITRLSICPSALPYTWNGVVFNTAGSKSATLANSYGCDSIATLILSVNSASTSTTNLAICANQFPFSWNGLTFNASGIQTAHLLNSFGCDSAATLNLTVKVLTSNTNLTVCTNELPYRWNGLVFNNSGAQTAHFTTAGGCDSSITLNLTVSAGPIPTGVLATSSHTSISLGSTVNLFTTSNAIGGTILTEGFNGTTNNWTVANLATGVNTGGPNFILTPYNTFIIDRYIRSNDNSQYYLSNMYYSQSNNVDVFLQSPAFSTVGYSTVSLSFYQLYKRMDFFGNGTNENIQVLASKDGNNWNTVYNHTPLNGNIGNNALVSETVSLNSYINEPVVYIRFRYLSSYYGYFWGIDNVNITGTPANNSYSWTSAPVGLSSSAQNPTGVSPSQTAVYKVKVTNSSGCFATDSVKVAVITPCTTFSETSITVCPSNLPYTWNGRLFTGAGTQTAILTNRSGCDSLATLNLRVATISSSNTLTVCANQIPYSWNGYLFQGPGVHTANLTSFYGCDSTATLTLTVNPIPTSVLASASDSSILNGTSVNLSAVSEVLSTSILNENFNGTTNNWVTINNGINGNVAASSWTLRPNRYDDYYDFHSNDNSQFYLSSSGDQGFYVGGITETYLQSPVFSTMGYSSVSLNFYQVYQDLYTNSDYSSVEVSTNGGASWTSVYMKTTGSVGSTSNFQQTTVSLNAFLNQPNIKIRFKYRAQEAYFWAIDNVSIIGLSTNTYAWSSSPAGFSSTVQNPTGIFPVVTTTYLVTATNAYGCTTSDDVTVIVENPCLPASVSIASNASNNTICAGTNVTFTASPINGGTNPVYQWKLNNNNVGTNSPTYSSASLTNNDVVKVVMTSNATPCSIGSPATSNTISTIVNTSTSTTNVAVFSTNPTYLWNGIVRNAPGTYTYNTTNAIGCDSVATLHLTVVDPILPVTSIDLSGTASDKQVKLSYKALNEREMANYAIERSAEGTNFTTIGMQQPINGTQASTSYGFIDNQPFVGINYYRIQGNSLNGQLQYSNVIAVKVGNMMPTVTVAPNPILHQILNLKLNQLVKGNYKMVITDVTGRTVYGKQLLYDGVGIFIKTNLPVSIKPGMYYVRLSGEGNDFMDKFIIQ